MRSLTCIPSLNWDVSGVLMRGDTVSWRIVQSWFEVPLLCVYPLNLPLYMPLRMLEYSYKKIMKSFERMNSMPASNVEGV